MAKLHIRRTVIFVILGALCGFLYVLFTPKVYEGNVQMVIGNPARATSQGILAPDVERVLVQGESRNPLSELSVLRGRQLFFNALTRLATERGNPDMTRDWERYYAMYDVLGEKESESVILQARAFSPEDAADLANYISQEYNDRRMAVSRSAVGRAETYVQNQIDKGEQELNAALEARRQFKADSSIADLTAAISQGQLYETQTRAALNESQSNLSATESEVRAAKAALDAARMRQDGEEVTQRNPAINKLESDIADLEARRAQLLATYLEDNPQVVAINDAIGSLRKELNAARQREYQISSRVKRPDPTTQQLELQHKQALIRRNAIQGQLTRNIQNFEQQQQRLVELAAAERKLADLDRDVLVRESNVRNLKIQLENLKNRGEGGAILATIMYAATPFPNPVYPNVLIIAILAIFGGGALGILYSFVVESLRLRIYTSWQLADLTGLPVVASLPKLPGGGMRQIEASFAGDSPRIMESMRLMAFSLVAQPHEGCKRLMFTGLDRMTGASSCAAQLATALAQTGSRVIFVDGDLASKSASRFFKAEGQKGLAEALQSTAAVESVGEALRETNSPNLKFLPAGVSNDRALKECETIRLEETLKWLSDRCDFLIFDCPPCLRNSEAARLAAETDEAYLVVSLRISSVPIVSAALDILRQAGAEVVRLLTTEGDKSEEALARESRITAAGRALPQ